MQKSEQASSAHARSFHYQDGLPAAWEQAAKFAGKDGRLAIMPDIVLARLETKPGEEPWETYFTTLSAEYFGWSKDGKLILIIAHGVGPMSTLDGICKAYSWEYKDKSRGRRGGRITQQEFWDLEAGKYGEVSIVDLEEYCARYEYPFLQVLKLSEALTDPVLKARFGSQTEQYLLAHAEYARRWHREQSGLGQGKRCTLGNLPKQEVCLNRHHGQHLVNGADDSDPYIIQVGDASNCCYTFGPENGHRQIEEGYAIGHLLSTCVLMHLCHEGNESLVNEVDCHEWWNGVRLIGIQAGGSVRSGIKPGPKAYDLLRKHWLELLQPVENPETVGFRSLVQIDEQWFTQYPKQGARMDTWEPEYVVTSIEEVGSPVVFRTTVGGYHGFFKFATNEVQAIAPPQANAYFFVSDPENEWHGGNPTHQTAMVQFYRIKVDATKRLIRSDKLAHDYEALMRLVRKEEAA